jgi:hypothetical protein
VTFIFLGVLQLGFTLHTRNTLVSCAAEGARVAARQGASEADGVARTKELIRAALADSYAEDVTASSETTSGGVRVVVLTVRAPVPVIGPFGIGESMDLVGRAFDEDQ